MSTMPDPAIRPSESAEPMLAERLGASVVEQYPSHDAAVRAVMGRKRPVSELSESVETIKDAMDDVLIGLTDGTLDQGALRKLPPWRAVLLGRVANKCGLMSDLQLEVMVRSAAHVGGNGTLGVEVWTDV